MTEKSLSYIRDMRRYRKEKSLSKQSLEERIEFAIDKEIRRTMMLLWGVLFLLVAAEGLMGDSGLLLLKILGASLAILMLNFVYEQRRGIAIAVTCSLIFIYTVIVWGNTLLGFSGL